MVCVDGLCECPAESADTCGVLGATHGSQACCATGTCHTCVSVRGKLLAICCADEQACETDPRCAEDT
jgi:hypothetical protein